MTVGSKKCHTGHEFMLAFLRNPRGRSPLVEPPPPRTVSLQAKPYNGYVVAPSPQRGNPRCSFQIGEGPAFQMLQAGNARNEETSRLKTSEESGAAGPGQRGK